MLWYLFVNVYTQDSRHFFIIDYFAQIQPHREVLRTYANFSNAVDAPKWGVYQEIFTHYGAKIESYAHNNRKIVFLFHFKTHSLA